MKQMTQRDKVERTFLDTIEKMAFLMGEAVPEGEDIEGFDATLHAEMSFGGYASGKVALLMPVGLCQELAANLLGLDPGEAQSEAQTCDALKELLNVFSGQLLTALNGDGVTFRLSIPAVSVFDPAKPRPAAASPAVAPYRFRVEGHPVMLFFSGGAQTS